MTGKCKLAAGESQWAGLGIGCQSVPLQSVFVSAFCSPSFSGRFCIPNPALRGPRAARRAMRQQGTAPVLWTRACASHKKHNSVKAARSHHTKRVTKVARRRPADPHQTAIRTCPDADEPADRPLVVIDAGHGGRDPGAIGVSGMMEKTITLDTAKELRSTLEMTGRYRVELTRTRDRTVSLAERLAFARKHDADLLIAIHADASRDRRARGASVYVSNTECDDPVPRQTAVRAASPAPSRRRNLSRSRARRGCNTA